MLYALAGMISVGTASFLMVTADLNELGLLLDGKLATLDDKLSEDVSAYIFDGNLVIENNGPNIVQISEISLQSNEGSSTEFLRKVYQDDPSNSITRNGITYIFSSTSSVGATIDSGETVELTSSDFDHTALDDLYGVITTDLGNRELFEEIEIFSELAESGDSSDSSNATSILDGLGVYMAIENVGTNGKVFYGQGTQPGFQTDIRQYVGIGQNDDWAVAITNDDSHQTLLVPAFGKKYNYADGSLQQVQHTKPNILGYSKERTLEGNSDVIIADKLQFSGTGRMLLKLNEGLSGQKVLLTGDAANGRIRILSSIYDLMDKDYVAGKGFEMYGPVTTNIQWTRCYAHTGDQGKYEWPIPNIKISARENGAGASSIIGTQNGDYFEVTMLSQSGGSSNKHSGCYEKWSASTTLYDKDVPGVTLYDYSGEFEQVTTIPSGVLYLLAEPNGDTITIKAESLGAAGDNLLYYTKANSDDVTMTGNEIKFFGDDSIITNLNDLSGQTVLIHGSIPDGGSLYLVESPIDLTEFSLDNAGEHPYKTVTGGQYTNEAIPVNEEFTSESNVDIDMKISYTHYHYCNKTGHHCHTRHNTAGAPAEMTYSGGNKGDHYQLNSITYTKRPSHGWGFWGYSHVTEIYDAGAFDGKLFSHASDFEQMVNIPNNGNDLYLVAKPNGGTITVSAVAFDPDLDAFFHVDGLDADIAYEISKDGITGVIGKTSSTGTITLSSDDVDFGVSTAPGGILTLYPGSVKHLGHFGMALFDVYNGDSIPLHIDDVDDSVYTAQNYIRWVFPVAVSAENIRIDDASLSYLTGDYESSQAIMIPVIPGSTELYATINGTDVNVQMADVATNTQIKNIQRQSSTSSDHATSGTVFAESNISTSTFLTATHKGVMIADMDLSVAGSADYTIDASYTGGNTQVKSCYVAVIKTRSTGMRCGYHSAPAYPGAITNLQSLTDSHRAQLESALSSGQQSHLNVVVDIFRNLEHVETRLIYTADSAQASTSSTFNKAGYGATNQVRVEYPMVTVSETIEVSVNSGDMVEFVIRANLDAAGVPTPSSSNAAYSAYASVTTEFGGGSILAGMS